MLKEAVQQKMRLRVTDYYQGQNLYKLMQHRLSLLYKEYRVKRQ